MCACAVEYLPYCYGCFSLNFTSSEMKRRLDSALPYETKRNRSDSSLDEETELSSQGSLMVLGERDIYFLGQYLKLLSILYITHLCTFAPGARFSKRV